MKQAPQTTEPQLNCMYLMSDYGCYLGLSQSWPSQFVCPSSPSPILALFHKTIWWRILGFCLNQKSHSVVNQIHSQCDALAYLLVIASDHCWLHVEGCGHAQQYTTEHCVVPALALISQSVHWCCHLNQVNKLGDVLEIVLALLWQCDTIKYTKNNPPGCSTAALDLLFDPLQLLCCVLLHYFAHLVTTILECSVVLLQKGISVHEHHPCQQVVIRLDAAHNNQCSKIMDTMTCWIFSTCFEWVAIEWFSLVGQCPRNNILMETSTLESACCTQSVHQAHLHNHDFLKLHHQKPMAESLLVIIPNIG